MEEIISKRDGDAYEVIGYEPVILEEKEKEPEIYNLQYLVYRLDIQREYKLSDLETKIISFILSYSNVSDNFYFGNSSLARIFEKVEQSICNAITALEEKGLVSCSYRMKANGGKVRYIRLLENSYSKYKKSYSQNIRKVIKNNNKINNNKINIYMSNFSSFWEQYPKKVSKKKTEEIFNRIVTSKKKEQEIIQGLLKYKKKWLGEKTDIKYIPNPTTWLNQARWEDEVIISNEQFNKYARDREKKWEEVKQKEKIDYKVDDGSGGLISLKELLNKEK